MLLFFKPFFVSKNLWKSNKEFIWKRKISILLLGNFKNNGLISFFATRYIIIVNADSSNLLFVLKRKGTETHIETHNINIVIIIIYNVVYHCIISYIRKRFYFKDKRPTSKYKFLRGTKFPACLNIVLWMSFECYGC